MSSIIKSDNGVSSGVTGIVQTADSSGQLALQTTTSGGSAVTALTIDNSQNITTVGNLGLGNSLSSWGSGDIALQINKAASVWSQGSNTYISNNLYYNGTNRIYTTSNYATEYQQNQNGTHIWSVASSGTTGGTVSLTTGMTLNNSGNLVFGTSNAGIVFNNSSALTNSTLNDYETGTWTPTDASGASLSFSGSGTYIKVGKLVTAFVSVAWPSNSNGSTASLGGWPFSFASSGGNISGGVVNYFSSGTSYYLRPLTTSSVIFLSPSGTTPTNTTLSTISLQIIYTYTASF